MNLKEKLKNILEKETSLKKMVVIYWPTGSWKTSMSIDVAKYLNSEVIWTDSRQIFKYLDIWTGKITEDEKEWVPHHMIDIITPDKEYSVWQFKKESEVIIEELYTKWKIPILCWWTGLYIDSIIYNFKVTWIPADEKIRNSLEYEAEKYWNEYVYNKLLEIDPKYAAELHPNNIRYVIRAIEVKMITGKSKMDFREEKKLKYDVLFLTPDVKDREYLYNRINTRVGMMFDDWLVEEVKGLLHTYNKNQFWMKTIWYREVIEHLEGNITLQECIELVQKNNRNYAKKQYTWFRKYAPKEVFLEDDC